MKRALAGAAGAVLMALIAGSAYPASNAAEQRGTVSAVSPSTPASSVVERDKQRYSNKKRAAARREREMKKADKSKQPAKSGSSVVERDRQRYDAQKRAAERRAIEMKSADPAHKNGEGNRPAPAEDRNQPAAN